jgi:hypothetical protein
MWAWAANLCAVLLPITATIKVVVQATFAMWLSPEWFQCPGAAPATSWSTSCLLHVCVLFFVWHFEGSGAAAMSAQVRDASPSTREPADGSIFVYAFY